MRLILTILLYVFCLNLNAQLFTIEEFIKSSEDKVGIEKQLSMQKQLVDKIINRDYSFIEKYGTEELKDVLTEDKVTSLIDRLENKYGDFQKTGQSIIKQTAEQNYLLTEIEFLNSSFDVATGFTEDLQISSLRIQPATDKRIWEKPEYGIGEINARDTTIKGLLGEIVTPPEDGKQAIVILVHGSGPNDMDGTLGPNKVFKDLALGFAQRGIASIRYNKRSYDYPGQLSKMINELTIEDEVVNDAVIAIEMAKDMGYKRVILIGHSLGGHTSPRIAELANPDGVVIMAGNSSPIIDLIVPQFEYLLKNDPNTPITEFQLNAIKVQINKVQERDYDEKTPSMLLPFGLSGGYWKSLEDYNPPQVAKKQKMPYLILNGSRDYQVDVEQAKGWKNGNKNPHSKTIIYKGMNHMFYRGEGVLIPSEYEIKTHVDQKVVEDIVNWIMSI